jgi:enterochelin esterase family protein
MGTQVMEDDLKPTYTAPMDPDTYQLLKLDQTAPWAVNGKDRYDGLKAATGEFDTGYTPCEESNPEPGQPVGKVSSIKEWQNAKMYPGTVRDLRFYCTAGMTDGQSDVNLMVFNDGIGYLGRNGLVRAAAVLDTLYARGEIRDTLAIFINPGRPVGAPLEAENQQQRNAADNQRSIEYDAITRDYGQFLLDEIIPLAESIVDCRVTEDPSRRIMIGMSSGGICAFTVAWHFPDQFNRVLSHCGSFTNIKGGHNYPWLIRTTPRKPIRVFMQSGENDIDGLFGNWPLANKQIASALAYAGYDYRFKFGVGGHTLAHGGALFAESIRWLLR